MLHTSEKLRSWWIQNLIFWQILAKYNSMKKIRFRVKNILTSSTILYWKARLVQNPKFRWLKAMLTIYTLMQILRLKVKKIYTFMQNLWLKVKKTLTLIRILYWKARLIQNPKFKVVESNVDNLYSHANPQVKSFKTSSVIHQWKAQVMVNPKLKILTNFGKIYFHAKF